MKVLCIRNCYRKDRYYGQDKTYDVPEDMIILYPRDFKPLGHIPEPPVETPVTEKPQPAIRSIVTDVTPTEQTKETPVPKDKKRVPYVSDKPTKPKKAKRVKK